MATWAKVEKKPALRKEVAHDSGDTGAADGLGGADLPLPTFQPLQSINQLCQKEAQRLFPNRL